MFALWVGLTVFFGPPRVAHAQWEAPPLKVIVLPFEGKGTGDLTAAEAVELELELAPNIRLVSSRGIRVALNKLAPDQNYLANDLASVMQEYEVDVLIRGERLNAETVGSQLRVSAIANDGYPRWQKAVPMPDDPVAKASDLGKRLVRVLRDWETLPPIEEHVVISMVEPEPNEPPSTPLRAPLTRNFERNRDEPRGNERGWDEQPEAIPAKPRRRRSKRNIRRRTSLLNEEPISDANNRKSPTEGAGLQVSFGMGTGVWQYQLSGPTEAFVAQVGADAYPVLELQARGWFSEAFGVDVDLTGGKLDFELNSGPSLSVAPERFSSYHLDGSAAFLVRVWRGKGKYPAFFALRLLPILGRLDRVTNGERAEHDLGARLDFSCTFNRFELPRGQGGRALAGRALHRFYPGGFIRKPRTIRAHKWFPWDGRPNRELLPDREARLL